MGLLGAIQDPQFRKDVARGLLDAGNRGAVAGLLGGPVDLATMALRPFGYNVEQPVGGSEWIGQKMQNLGLVSEKRNPLAEGLAAFAGPMAAQQIAPKVFAAELRAMENMAKPSPMNAATRGQAGMLRIPGRGQIPETERDVNKLADRFGRLLDDAGVAYTPDKSGISPAQYFYINDPRQPADEVSKYGQAFFKVRISDHINKHGADFSVDPHTGKTFEEMIKEVQAIGVPISEKVKRQKNMGIVPDDVLEKVLGRPLSEMTAESLDMWRKKMKYVYMPSYPNGGYWGMK